MNTSTIKTVSFLIAALFLAHIGLAATAKAPAKPSNNNSDKAIEHLLDPLKKIQAAFSQAVKKEKNPFAKKSSPKGSQFEGMRLEGVASGPKGTVAILNGVAYRAGEEIRGNKIMAIYPSYIQIENQTTHVKMIIWVNGTPSDQEMDVIGYQKGVLSADVLPIPVTWGDKIQVWLAQKGLGNKQIIEKALLDLRLIESAVGHMKNEKNQTPKEIFELIQQRFLPLGFLRRQFFYLFYLDAEGVHANPRAGYSKLPYFFVGQDSVIRFERKTPAGMSSSNWNHAA